MRTKGSRGLTTTLTRCREGMFFHQKKERKHILLVWSICFVYGQYRKLKKDGLLIVLLETYTFWVCRHKITPTIACSWYLNSLKKIKVAFGINEVLALANYFISIPWDSLEWGSTVYKWILHPVHHYLYFRGIGCNICHAFLRAARML